MANPVIAALRARALAGTSGGGLVVPLPTGLAFFDEQVTLDGATYTIRMRWNVRASAFYLDVLDSRSSTYYLAGKRAVVGFPLGAYDTGRAPAGAFIFVDTSGQNLEPAIADLGSRVVLLYLPAALLGLS